jgi:hypothetical protein
MIQASANIAPQETAAYLPNIFMFGFPGSRLRPIGEHVVHIANSAGINPEPYTMLDLTALDTSYPNAVRQENHVRFASLLADTDIPKVVLASTEVLLGDSIHGSAKLRDKIGAFAADGKRSGTTVLLNIPPQDCAGNLPATGLPPILTEGGGSRARAVRQRAQDLAHEIVHYKRSAPLEIVGSLIAHSLFGTPADHMAAARHSVWMSSTGF